MDLSDCFRSQKEAKEEKQKSTELLAAEKREHASAVQKMQVSAVLDPHRSLSMLMQALRLRLDSCTSFAGPNCSAQLTSRAALFIDSPAYAFCKLVVKKLQRHGTVQFCLAEVQKGRRCS